MIGARLSKNIPARLAGTTVALGLLVGVIAATPAGADWLVMHDGSRVETDGPWSERGKLIVFTDTSGQLASIRSSEVDLDASRRATTEAQQAATQPPPPPPPPAPSVMRITDADVEHVDPIEDESSEAEEGEDSGEPAPLVSVLAWERDDSPAGDGLEIRATLENQGADVAVGIIVTVTLYDETGQVLAATNASLAASGLVPGQTTDMVADFPGIFDFNAVDFDIEQRAIRTQPIDQSPDLLEDFGSQG